MPQLVLHNYFRSSTSIRVRVALNLKGLPFEYVAHHLRRGEQRSAAYRELNRQMLVPSLVLPDGAVLTQSLAIMEYLDEVHPEPPLLPAGPAARARVRAMALAIACEIHPLNNLRVLNYLERDLALPADARTAWYHRWIAEGFTALERLLADPRTGAFCHGDTPGLADICLVPQVANALRFKCPLEAYPTIRRIYATCLDLPAFATAQPERQPDAE